MPAILQKKFPQEGEESLHILKSRWNQTLDILCSERQARAKTKYKRRRFEDEVKHFRRLLRLWLLWIPWILCLW